MTNTDETSRTKNSIKNACHAVGGQVVNLIVQFILRTVFIRYLSIDYLGVSTLFTNILTFLSLAELGVGTAITFSLYKPIANNDSRKIAVLMKVFRKAYMAIGTAILLIGFSLTPFLSFFYKEVPKVDNLAIIYLLFVINSGISYFFSYKSIFIIANQKNYIVTNNTCFFKIVAAILQGVSLVLQHNYLVYLVIGIICTVISNIRISFVANRIYPVLKAKTNDKLDITTKNEIISNIRALVYHRLGGIIVFSTDNLLLSKMFGVGVVGLYSNYSLIVSSIEGIINQAFSSIAASVGNLGSTEDNENKIRVYNNIFFINFWIYSFSSIALTCLIDPFIRLWVGNNYLMEMLCVIFIIINFYLKGMRQTNMTFNAAFGLVPYYKYMPIPECIINLVTSVLLAKILGTVGVFIGTTISTLSTCLWIEAKVLFNYGLKAKLKLFFLKYIKYAAITLLGLFAALYLCSFVTNMGISGFIERSLIVAVVPNFIIFLLSRKTVEYSFVQGLIKDQIKNFQKSK